MSFNVPSKRIRPLSIKIIRSVIASISCISWVVKIIVVLFFLFSSEINFLTVNFERASSSIVGSSKKRILGLCKRESCNFSSSRIGSKDSAENLYGKNRAVLLCSGWERVFTRLKIYVTNKTLNLVICFRKGVLPTCAES